MIFQQVFTVLHLKQCCKTRTRSVLLRCSSCIAAKFLLTHAVNWFCAVAAFCTALASPASFAHTSGQGGESIFTFPPAGAPPPSGLSLSGQSMTPIFLMDTSCEQIESQDCQSSFQKCAVYYWAPINFSILAATSISYPGIHHQPMMKEIKILLNCILCAHSKFKHVLCLPINQFGWHSQYQVSCHVCMCLPRPPIWCGPEHTHAHDMYGWLDYVRVTCILYMTVCMYCSLLYVQRVPLPHRPTLRSHLRCRAVKLQVTQAWRHTHTPARRQAPATLASHLLGACIWVTSGILNHTAAELIAAKQNGP